MPTTLLRKLFFIYKLLNTFFLYLLPPKTTPSPPPPPPSLSPPPARPLRRMDSEELRRVFRMFDKNGDGKITKSELSDSLENMGIFVLSHDLDLMIEKVDLDGDNCVDISEFAMLYKSISEEREGDQKDEMREAFNVFDKNGDGFISAEELRVVLAAIGLKHGHTAEDCRKMITTVDVDGDGRVDFVEFKQMMRGGGFTVLG